MRTKRKLANERSGLAEIILIVILAGLAAAVYYYYQQNQGTVRIPAINNEAGSVVKEENAFQKVGSVQITRSGMLPATIRVKKGALVTWVNVDSKDHSVVSDSYPSDGFLAGFDSDVMTAGDSFSFTFEKKGTFSYHDQAGGGFRGTVVVVD